MAPHGRFLLVSAWPPWGRVSGYFQRVRTSLEALRRHGTVDLCMVAEWRLPGHDDVPAGFGEVTWLQVEETAWSAPKAALGLMPPPRQRRLHAGSMPLAHEWFSRDYDLTWCHEQRTYEPIARLVRGPIVLDLHEVMSASVIGKRRIVLRHPIWSRTLRRVIRQPDYVPGLARQWRRWEQHAAEACDRVVVCSDLDRSRMSGNAAVVPNCYPTPVQPAGRRWRTSGRLDIGMVALLDYQPNLDGAHWFASKILPVIRAAEPTATLHLVGRARPTAVRALAHLPGVVLHGFVDDLEQELAKLAILVAPVRFGSGTRLKILEAFAHEVPIVATTFGAEGLDADDGQHLLVRDDPASFAEAVLSIYRDASLRARLTSAASRLHAERYTQRHGEEAVEQQIEAVLSRRIPDVS